jgi:hypothetical protein
MTEDRGQKGEGRWAKGDKKIALLPSIFAILFSDI